MKITTTIPLAPTSRDDAAAPWYVDMLSGELTALLHTDGRLHGCVMCLGSTVHRFGPAELAAAVPRDPRLPAQWSEVPDCGLHPRCVPRLIMEWAIEVHGVDGFAEEDTAEPTWRVEADRVEREAAGTARRAGAYGRRRNTD